MCQAAFSLNQRVVVASPGEPDRGRPVSDVISEDAKSGPQARLRRRRCCRHGHSTDPITDTM